MKILIAGATGAIGQPVILQLKEQQHTVYGITQSENHKRSIEEKGAFGVVLDVLDREAVFAALEQIKPDIVINMLTRLPKEYTPAAMREAAPLDGRIRMEGGSNLLAAAEKSRAKRIIVQSSAFWYEPGEGLADETASFAFKATAGIASGCQMYDAIEKTALQSSLEGVALRFGFFYGPGTWFQPHGNLADQVKQQKFPLVGSNTGIWNFVHIEDAAQSIVLSLDAPVGAYNIVSDSPTPLSSWLPAFAKSLNAPPPRQLSEIEGIEERGADAVYYATSLRGASNGKAKQILHFKPRPFSPTL